MRRGHTDSDLFELLAWGIAEVLEQQEKIMADFTALNDAIAKLSTDVDTALANAGATDQAAVDAATAAVGAIDAKVAPPAPPAA